VTSGRGDTVHVPVLLEKVLYYLAPISGRVYIDATVGPGGHAEAILEASAPNGRLLGLDRDPEALELARARLLHFGDRVCLEQASFADLDVIACRRGFCPADGVLFASRHCNWLRASGVSPSEVVATWICVLVLKVPQLPSY